MINRNIVVTFECFVKKENKYLMLHRNPDKRIMPDVWMAPGGHREFNEGLYEAARREIMEETGLTIKNIKIKAHGNAYLKDLNEEFFFHLLTAEYASGELIQNIKDGELVWLTKEEIINLDKVLAELKDVIPLILNDDNKVISYKAAYEKGSQISYFEIEKS